MRMSDDLKTWNGNTNVVTLPPIDSNGVLPNMNGLHPVRKVSLYDTCQSHTCNHCYKNGLHPVHKVSLYDTCQSHTCNHGNKNGLHPVHTW